MVRGFVIAGLLALLLSGPARALPQRPDFSGRWQLVSSTGLFAVCSRSLTVKQDAATLTMEYPVGSDSGRGRRQEPAPARDMRKTYKLDGSDTREVLSVTPPRLEDLAPGVMNETAVAGVTRAGWNGDQLIAVFHRTMKLTWAGHTPPEFERLWTYRDAISLDDQGQLLIDHLAIIDPLPGDGLPKRMELPTSWTCRYRKEP